MRSTPAHVVIPTRPRPIVVSKDTFEACGVVGAFLIGLLGWMGLEAVGAFSRLLEKLPGLPGALFG